MVSADAAGYLFLSHASHSGIQMLQHFAALTALAGATLVLGVDQAPTRTKYRIDQSLSQEIDATAAGAAKQTISFKTSSFITVTLADSGGGKVMRVVIDSLRGDSTTPIPAAVLDSARGAEFRGFVEKSGKLSGLVPVTSTSAATQVQGLLSDFFPLIRSGVKVGDAWSDTTAKVNGVGADSVTVRRVSAYKASGKTTHGARKAVMIMEDFTSSVAGTQPTPSGPAKIEGNGSGKGSYYIGTRRPVSWRQLGTAFGAEDLRLFCPPAAPDHNRSNDQSHHTQVSGGLFVKRSLAVLTLFAVAACGGAATRSGQPSGPTPEADPSTPPGVPEPTGLIYHAVKNAAYTMVRHDSLSLQLPGGANQQQLIDRTAYLAVTLVPDTGGYQVTIVLDSLQASAGGVPAALDSLVPAWGTKWTGSLSANGELSALKADRSTTLGDQVGGTLRSLFPELPPGGVRAGMQWADTTDVPIRADAFDATEHGMTTYRASESDDPRAKKAVKIESNGNYDRKGKGCSSISSSSCPAPERALPFITSVRTEC